MQIDPDTIFFTHSRFRKQFSGYNKTIEQTFNEIKSGQTQISDIPMITIYTDDQKYFSQNNRRLYLFKMCKKEGLLLTITVRIKPAPSKYLNQTLSLNGSPSLK